ncbi:PadR family transcriptional regulator [Ktedonosporobacter rubrisoli]|uniref:PadR family transcriptional regulator n=1 Tax=Ktedonosporobacter rubrisoli TaxID=2509675 RepID=A0A4P6JI13_KTERU|nr:PadR family transcriptional regulator [Ktedonosporobacter rubrisoli]QBD74687.1 PadR family transcriptional regulator [Ktedonosporobacter rubrisoli]
MDDRALLLLGLLRMQDLHGYQLNEFIEKNLSLVTEMKKATAYAILDRLREAGYIRMSVEQKGNRPQRQVYSITSAGEAHFLHLLRENLARADRTTFAGDIGLMFFDQLPRNEAIKHLKHRLSEIEALLTQYERSLGESRHTEGVNLAIEHLVVLLRADQEWLSQLLRRLEPATDSLSK